MKRMDIKRFFKLTKNTEALKRLVQEVKSIKPLVEEVNKGDTIRVHLYGQRELTNLE